MRTSTEIKNEIQRLQEIKPKVRRFTMFGDDNHHKIDIAVRVLSEDMDEEDISEYFEDADENSEAYQTLQWKNGEDENGSPAEQWQELVK